MTTSSSPTGLKVSAPEPFTGDRKKVKAFIIQVRLNLKFHASNFRTEDDKVLYAATFLRDGAFDWFEPYLTDYMGNAPTSRRPETIRIFGNLTAFEEKFKSVYGTVDEERAAERDLQRLRQVTSVTKYTSEFQQLSSRLDWDDSALAARFYYGLKEIVKDEISRTDRPTTLAGLTDLAVKIDNRIYERQMERGQQRKPVFHPNVGKHRNPGQAPRGSYPIAMELDATQEKRRPGLTKAQRDERMKKNLCLYCGKSGHRAKECKAKQQPSATMVNQARRAYDMTNASNPNPCKKCGTFVHFTKDHDYLVIVQEAMDGKEAVETESYCILCNQYGHIDNYCPTARNQQLSMTTGTQEVATSIRDPGHFAHRLIM